MKHFVATLLTVLVSASALPAFAQITPPKTMKVKVAIGLGWQLCPERHGLPSLDTAFMCSGLNAVPKTVEVELTNAPAAKPEWLFWEGPYNATEQFKDITITLEANVMYAKYNGITSGFVDGRIMTTRNGVASAPVYFRTSAEGGFANMTYSSTYGAMIPFPLSGQTGEFSPYMSIAAPKP